MDIGNGKLNIRDLLDIATEKSPDKIALIENETKLTYRELRERVNKLVNYLNQLELKKGARVALYSNKSYNQVIAILAILSTDLTLVPITRFLKPEQVRYIVDDADIKLIITDKTKIENIEAIDFRGKVISFEFIDDNMVYFKEIYKCFNSRYKRVNIDLDSDAIITYSFGSDGSQKGVIIAHKNLIGGAEIVSEYLNIREDDIISGLLSFNLDYGLNQIFCSLYRRATLAVHKFILPNGFFAHLIRDRVTILAVMPVYISKMFDEDIHKLPLPKQLDHIRVITSSGGTVTPSMLENIQRYFKRADFYSMHGLTEALRSTYLEPSQINIRPNSIGKAIPKVEVYILNESGKECKPFEVGELIHRGACIYKGYLNSPEETKKRFKSIEILKDILDLNNLNRDEIVVKSGDLVYRDREGFLYYVGRADDVIIIDEYRVSPKEIEDVIYKYIPKIKKCAVFGVLRDDIEEIALVYSADSKIPKNEILFELKRYLANYMIPTIIEYRRELPLKASHHEKVDREALKRLITKFKIDHNY